MKGKFYAFGGYIKKKWSTWLIYSVNCDKVGMIDAFLR